MTFSEHINVVGDSSVQLTIKDGLTRTLTCSPPGEVDFWTAQDLQCPYTVVLGDDSPTKGVTISNFAIAGVITDDAGNEAMVSLPALSKAMIFDTIVPQIKPGTENFSIDGNANYLQKRQKFI